MTAKRVAIRIIVITGLLPTLAAASIQGTPHDLSAVPGGNTCSFCHTPHGALAGTPLWNHKLSKRIYEVYWSSSLDAEVGQPTGSSKLCLSCHDGTIALEATVRGGSGRTYMPPGSANLGTDLSDDHPVSFVYSAGLSNEDPQIRTPDSLPDELRLVSLTVLYLTEFGFVIVHVWKNHPTVFYHHHLKRHGSSPIGKGPPSHASRFGS